VPPISSVSTGQRWWSSHSETVGRPLVPTCSIHSFLTASARLRSAPGDVLGVGPAAAIARGRAEANRTNATEALHENYSIDRPSRMPAMRPPTGRGAAEVLFGPPSTELTNQEAQGVGIALCGKMLASQDNQGLSCGRCPPFTSDAGELGPLLINNLIRMPVSSGE